MSIFSYVEMQIHEILKRAVGSLPTFTEEGSPNSLISVATLILLRALNESWRNLSPLSF